MSIARVWLALAAMASLMWMTYGCSDRERLNPLDPLNPKTHGKPGGLFAISMRDTVVLGWQALGLRNLSGYRIYRRTTDNLNFSLIDSVGGEAQRFREFGLSLGRHYIYRITAYSGATESSPSDTVGITPGPAFTWIADGAAGIVAKLTHDGVHEIFRSRSFFQPLRVQANPKTGQLWVINGRELRRLEASGSLSTIRLIMQNPVDLAVDSTENSVWVADKSIGVFKFDADGVELAHVPLPGVVSIAFDFPTSELWALDGRQKRLWRIDRAGSNRVDGNVKLLNPRSILIHRARGEAWIADSTRILRISAGGQVDSTRGHTFSYARKVALNQNTGECWAIDWSPSFAQSKVVKFSSDGSRLFVLEGFSSPSALSVNVFDGSCFVTEPQLSRLTHVSATGQIIDRSGDFFGPIDVDVENRPLN
jgi:hypothetical protein